MNVHDQILRGKTFQTLTILAVKHSHILFPKRIGWTPKWLKKTSGFWRFGFRTPRAFGHGPSGHTAGRPTGWLGVPVFLCGTGFDVYWFSVNNVRIKAEQTQHTVDDFSVAFHVVFSGCMMVWEQLWLFDDRWNCLALLAMTQDVYSVASKKKSTRAQVGLGREALIDHSTFSYLRYSIKTIYAYIHISNPYIPSIPISSSGGLYIEQNDTTKSRGVREPRSERLVVLYEESLVMTSWCFPWVCLMFSFSHYKHL